MEWQQNLLSLLVPLLEDPPLFCCVPPSCIPFQHGIFFFNTCTRYVHDFLALGFALFVMGLYLKHTCTNYKDKIVENSVYL